MDEKVDAERVAIASSDITGAVIRLPELLALMASADVPEGDPQALQNTRRESRSLSEHKAQL